MFLRWKIQKSSYKNLLKLGLTSSRAPFGLLTHIHPYATGSVEVENWFLAARRQHPLIVAWRDLYNAGWEHARRRAASLIFLGFQKRKKPPVTLIEWTAALDIPRKKKLLNPLHTKCEAWRLYPAHRNIDSSLHLLFFPSFSLQAPSAVAYSFTSLHIRDFSDQLRLMCAGLDMNILLGLSSRMWICRTSRLLSIEIGFLCAALSLDQRSITEWSAAVS